MDRGQSLTEYALIMVLVAIVVVIALSAMGGQAGGVIGGIADALRGRGAALTTLGSSFGEINESMIALMQQFYEENGRWPRSWGEYAYTDLGLDPSEWQQAYEGIVYKPGGNRLMIEPAEGYTFYVNDVDGNRMALSSGLNWNLVYDMPSGTWHYHHQQGALLDISTLEVVKE